MTQSIDLKALREIVDKARIRGAWTTTDTFEYLEAFTPSLVGRLLDIVDAAVNRDNVLRSKQNGLISENEYFDALGKAEYMLDSAIAAHTGQEVACAHIVASKGDDHG